MSLASPTPSPAAASVVVATLDVRNTADRWPARAPLLVEQLVSLDPDVVGLQEVRRFPDQARRIAREAAGDCRRWTVRRAYKTGPKRMWDGVAVLSRLPVTGHARLRLRGESRVALRVTVTLPEGQALDVYVTHLADRDEEVRCAQARRLLEWMDERPAAPAVVVGDLNSRPGSPPIRILSRRLRSAYAEVHRSEPPRTVPPGGTRRGGVIDYVLVTERVAVLDAGLAFDRPSPHDAGLFPSDHLGVWATVSVLPAG